MSSEWWTFDFVVYKKGEKEALAFSSPAPLHARSVNTEIDLEPGDYIVHVRKCLFPTIDLAYHFTITG
jgi:hypothetical protein